MASFNYSRFKYFDKNGNELVLRPLSHVKLTVKNPNNEDLSSEYAFVTGDPDMTNFLERSSMLPIKKGSRYNITSDKLHDDRLSVTTTISKDGSVNDIEGILKNKFTKPPRHEFLVNTYTSSNGEENYPELTYNDLSASDKRIVLNQSRLNILSDARFFPTYTFETKIGFGKISTGLIETQTVFVLVENENDTDEYGVPKMTTLKEYADTDADAHDYIDRFELFFFIDCREQKDFRMIHVKYDEMEWSDRSVLDFTKEYEDGSNDNGYSVTVGFSGENDGVYEQKMYVCLLDTNTSDNDYIGDVYPIGEIILQAETEGEDERYRSFFTNFGIPDPKEYDEIFKETDINDDLPDYVSVNRHSKKMFLSYSDIFPYTGTYKALINAVKFLGYENDIFFKEWYKEIGNPISDNVYTSYEITYGSSLNKNLIQNTSVSERIHLRKMNWLSMMYRLSLELDKTEDIFCFPQVMTNYRNFNADMIAKLIGIRKWLEKYVIGVNCHIIDVGGEGIVFERNSMQKFGSYQTVLDFNDEGTVGPEIMNKVEVLEDGSANIKVSLHPTGDTLTIEDCEDLRFSDLCDGYFNNDGVFCGFDGSVGDSSLFRYFGKTFEFNDNIDSVVIRARGEHPSYMYRSDGTDRDIYNTFSSLLVDNNEIRFDYTVDTGKPLNSPFTRLPVIEIENGIIKMYVNGDDHTGVLQYYANIYPDASNGNVLHRIDVLKNGSEAKTRTYWLDDFPTLLPPTSVYSNGNVVITPPSKRLNIDADVINMSKPYDQPYSVSITGTTMISHSQPWSTSYGLRFCIDNMNGIPCFKMIGYEEKWIMMNSDHFPDVLKSGSGKASYYEYFLEMINGRMIFPSNEDGLVSVLNFKYDPDTKKRVIYVTTYMEQEFSSIYEYNNGSSYVTNFSKGGWYGEFVKIYDESPDMAVLYDNVKQINVNHAGKYEVSAIAYSKSNCVFAKKAEGFCDVKTRSSDLIILTADKTSNNAYNIYEPNADYEYIKTVFTEMTSQPECIFGYEPKLQIDDVDGVTIQYAGIQNSSSDSSLDFGTMSVISKKDFDFATLSSMSDRFDIPYTVSDNKSHDIAFVMVRRTKHGSHMFCDTQVEDASIMMRLNITSGSPFEKLKTLALASERSEGTMLDVTIFIYDIIREYPLYSAPGVMRPLDGTAFESFLFMPLSSMQSLQIEYNFLDSSTFAFYAIPTWMIPCTVEHLYSDINDLTINMPYYPFEKTLPEESMSMLTYRNAYDSANTIKTINTKSGSTSKERDYFGHGSYRIKTTNVVPPIQGNDQKASVSLYASVNPDPDGKYVVMNGFDGSTWFSPNSMDFMEYKVDVSSESDNTIGSLVLVDNSYSIDALMFTDKQYSVSLRDIDTMYAMQLWDWNTSLYTEPSMIETVYQYTVPVRITIPYVSLIPVVDETKGEISQKYPYSIEWRIYKRIDGKNRRLIFKCANKVIHIKFMEYGIYDIEYDYYDRNGNKYTKIMYNAVTVLDTLSLYESLDDSTDTSRYSFKWQDYVCVLEDDAPYAEWQTIE